MSEKYRYSNLSVRGILMIRLSAGDGGTLALAERIVHKSMLSHAKRRAIFSAWSVHLPPAKR